MRVLIACEESQRVCIEMRRLGHEAYSADIQDCSGGYPEWHIKGDVIPLINGSCEFTTADGELHTIPGKWDLLIAHPPCTYLSNAGASFLYRHGVIDPVRYEKGLRAKDFFMKFLCADCTRIAVENPLPSRIYNLPPCSQIIHPFLFGDPYTKKTLLWLRGLPPLFSTEIVIPTSSWCSLNRNSRVRSKTFEGIARAMAQQWAGIKERKGK